MDTQLDLAIAPEWMPASVLTPFAVNAPTHSPSSLRVPFNALPFSGVVPSVREDDVRCNGGLGSAHTSLRVHELAEPLDLSNQPRHVLPRVRDEVLVGAEVTAAACIVFS